MRNSRILICGGGIAGLTLAYWLDRHGFAPTVIERAPGLRGGGCMIDFWGAGYDVAERMNLVDTLRAAHIDIPTMDLVDTQGQLVARLPIDRLRQALEWRHFNLLRSALESSLYALLARNVQVMFGRSIVSLEQDPHSVGVVFDDGTTDRYHLVVGAEGLRSRTRRLVFGPDGQFERFLGYYVASYTIACERSRNAIFASHTVPRKEVGLYSVDDEHMAVFLLFAVERRLERMSVDARKRTLHEAFGSVGWRAPELLAGLDDAQDFYFDAVSQIAMPNWHRGRIVLLGDACQCVSLVAGQGASLAMAGAYVLAGELKESHGEHLPAFERYQSFMKPHIDRTQEMARQFASSFVPSSKLRIAARNVFIRVLDVPMISQWFVDRYFNDDMDLEGY